ncbi:MAG: hypothetical protein IJ806_05875 [Ruminococcus sp.]|nr:hypothetical protein [Ruminococcus sp.]
MKVNKANKMLSSAAAVAAAAILAVMSLTACGKVNEEKTVSVGNAAMAKADAETVTDAEDTEDAETTEEEDAEDFDVDNWMDNLTDEERAELEKLYDRQAEIYNEVWGDYAYVSDAEYERRLAPFQEELDEIEKRIEELERKANLYYSGTDWYENLTKEEIAEINRLYDRQYEIYDLIYGDVDSLTQEEYDERYAPYAEELDEIIDRIYELEMKNGDYSVEYEVLTEEEAAELNELYRKLDNMPLLNCPSEEEEKIWKRIEELEKKEGMYPEEYEEDYGDLTEEEIAELNSLIAEQEELYDKIYGEFVYLSDAEYERRYAVYEEEIDALEEKIDALYEKTGLYDYYVEYEGLSREENEELDKLYARIGEIEEETVKGADLLTWDEYYERRAPFEEELDSIYERIDELEAKICYEDEDMAQG